MAEDAVRWQGAEELDCWNAGSTAVSDGMWEQKDQVLVSGQKTLSEPRLHGQARPKLGKRQEVSDLNEKELQHTAKERGSGRDKS